MSKKNIVHTGLGIELARRLAGQGDRIFTVKRAREVAPEVGLSDNYLNQALYYLVKAGWVVRLRQGLYALSSSVPGLTSVHEFEIAMALVNPAAISHWSALHYHGLSEQIPRRIFVLTTTEATIPRHRGRAARTAAGYSGITIRETNYRFIQVNPERYFGIEKIWVGEVRASITDPERTLLDGLARPKYCGDFAEVLHAFEVRGKALDIDLIIDYALRLDAATAKRLGWVLERQGVALSRLKRLAELPVKGYRPLDPSGPGRGPVSRRWMIRENLPGRSRL